MITVTVKAGYKKEGFIGKCVELGEKLWKIAAKLFPRILLKKI
jgi:hypothetical protein